MALRVLLADESSTIKKVFQLALQDFAVDVRPVNVGVDVLAVAHNFKPDIVFADVLLQKKNGYDVASELKQDPQMKNVPVVLMWSGFLELDEDKFQASMANAQLEKPFDVAALRKLVTDLVPRTQGQSISQFLSFPKTPDFQDSKKSADSPPPPPVSAKHADSEDFTQVPIPKMKGGADKYRLNLKPEELEPQHIPVKYDMPTETTAVEEIFKGAEAEDEAFAIREKKSSKPATPPPLPSSSEDDDDIIMEDADENFAPRHSATTQSPSPSPRLTEAQVEKLLREQSKEIIEAVAWKVIPEIATQIIQREIDRLLKERDLHAP